MSDPSRMELLEQEIATLHIALEQKGMNTKMTKDVFGRTFAVPVDDEHKATLLFPVMFNNTFPYIIPNTAQPHMRAFWAATFGFFSTFFSVFAPAALMPTLKKDKSDGGLDLTPQDIADSGALAVSFTIIMRILAGPLCDKFGARWTFFGLLWIGIPGIVLLAFAEGAAELKAARAIIGLSLASFVTCQVWCSQMFAKSIVGTANATAGGWGNLGGGVTQLVMPLIYEGILKSQDQDVDKSWRLCMIVPAALHVISSLCVLSGQDLPDGNYRELEKSGAKNKTSGCKTALIGFSNINAWILFIGYAFCFGVELTMNNKGVLYFYKYYGVPQRMAGIYGSIFGLMNIFARSWGGILSDAMNAKYGIRGRIWAMWVIQALEGLMCIILGLISISKPSPTRMYKDQVALGPWTGGFSGGLTDVSWTKAKGAGDCSVLQSFLDEGRPDSFDWGDLAPYTCAPPNDGDGMWGQFNSTLAPSGYPYTYGLGGPDGHPYTYTITAQKGAWVPPCGFDSIKTNYGNTKDGDEIGGDYFDDITGMNVTGMGGVWLNYGTAQVAKVVLPTVEPFIMVGDYGYRPDGDECVANTDGLLGTALTVMVFFSIFVQMSEGLHFGIVPYVSRPALGVVSGMVGAGGNLGAVIGTRGIIAPDVDVDAGFITLGAVIMATSVLFFAIYFPEHGGMLFKKGALGSYDPQLYKPDDADRGADQMDYSAAAAAQKTNRAEEAEM